MNLTEFAELGAQSVKPLTVDATDVEGPDRTLIYGYTVDRWSWHVYLKQGEIHLFVYESRTSGAPGPVYCYEARTSWVASNLVPSKRVYPESVDAQFAHLLLARGVTLPYTTFNEERYGNVAGLDFHAPTR